MRDAVPACANRRRRTTKHGRFHARGFPASCASSRTSFATNAAISKRRFPLRATRQAGIAKRSSKITYRFRSAEHCAACTATGAWQNSCRSLQGSAFDVIVDIRHGSPTYRQMARRTSSTQIRTTQVYIPAGCLHGFLALEDNTMLSLQADGGVRPCVRDRRRVERPRSGRSNGRFGGMEPLLSPKDAANPTLRELRPPVTNSEYP